MTPAEIISRYETLKGDNSTMESHLQEIAEYVYPRRQDFITKQTKGENLVEKIYDSTPIHANELLASGLHGMMTSPSSPWFGLKLDEDLMKIKEVQNWLAEVNNRMFMAINRPDTGFSSAMHEFYMEYGAFGTGCLFVTENIDRDGLLFQTRPIAEMQFAESEDGRITTFLRRFDFTVNQCKEKWGKNVSKRIEEKTNPDELVEIVHAVYPENGKVVSQYIEVVEKHMLQDGFYHEQALFAPRFYKTTFEVWGRSPSFTSLPDIKMLNQMAKTTIRAAEKVVDPPLQMPNDGFTAPARVMAGGVNYYEAGSRDRIEPLNTGAQIQLSEALMEEIRMRIKRSYFNDQLELNRRPQMTATEVLQRTEERLRLMSPVLGRLQNELLSPMIDRIYGIMERMGSFPDAPEMIQGRDLSIEYMSPLARSNSQIEAQGIARTLELMTPLIQQKPEMLDKIDTDFAFEHVGIDMYNVDPRLFHPQKEVDARRAARAQDAQNQQKIENSTNLARAVPQGSA